MTTLAEQASITFNKVMDAHSIELRTTPLDFAIGLKCILPALNRRGEMLSNRLFDLLFPRLKSGIYYQYLTFNSFQAVVKYDSLRFFSTKKLSSVGEFIPLCQDLELDGYWRIGADGKPEGTHASMMDDIFYKSFVSSSEDNAPELWDTFTEGGTGVRIAVRIDVHADYQDFRQVSYQGSPAVAALDALLKAFHETGWIFVPFGISRMPSYYQLKQWSHHKECRLIAKRHPGAHDGFPFIVGRDEGEGVECNYIDCSLTNPTCSAFQLKLVAAVPGPKVTSQRNTEITDLWNQHHARVETAMTSPIRTDFLR
jgi:hypothetical protein